MRKDFIKWMGKEKKTPPMMADIQKLLAPLLNPQPEPPEDDIEIAPDDDEEDPIDIGDETSDILFKMPKMKLVDIAVKPPEWHPLSTGKKSKKAKVKPKKKKK